MPTLGSTEFAGVVVLLVLLAQPTADKVREQVEHVADTLQRQLPAVAELLRDAKADLTAFADFP